MSTRALIGLAHMLHFQGRRFDAVIAEAVSLGREGGDAWVMSFGLFMQALAALECGDYEQAATLSQEANEAAIACGDEVQVAGPRLVMANIAVQNADYDRAQQLYDEAIAIERHAGEIWGLSIILAAAAGLRILRQEFDQARVQASEALSLCEELDDPRGIAWSLDVFAGLLAARDHGHEAARLWGASDRLLEGVGGQLSPEIRWLRNRYFESAKKSLGEEPFEAARAEGRAMPLVHAIALAHEQTFRAVNVPDTR